MVVFATFSRTGRRATLLCCQLDSDKLPCGVQEMYAFTIACYNEGVPKVHLHKRMMSQPPWDSGESLPA